jgi:hypothetical protein
MTWKAAAPAVSAAFLGSFVEAVEARTILLAVATVRCWRPAGLGRDTPPEIIDTLNRAVGRRRSRRSEPHGASRSSCYLGDADDALPSMTFPHFSISSAMNSP